MRFALFILISVCLIQSIASWPTFVNNLVTGWNWFDANGNTHVRKRACQLGESGPDCDECGVTFANPNARIVGGYEAVPHSWPAASMIIFQYKANIQVRNNIVRVDREFLCGGFLVDRTTVVTAAHCITEEIEVNVGTQSYTIKVVPNNFFPTQGSMFKVFLGIHNNQGALHGGDVSPGVRAVVSQVIRHPNYDKETNLNDIAILKLANPVKLDQNVQLACLPNPAVRVYPTQSNIPTFAIGWGTLYSNGPTASTLQNVRLNVYDGKFCENVAPFTTKDWTRQICAGEYNGGKDTCQGDSGGAIFVQDTVNNKAKYIAVGIVSYGEGCAERGKPGIYTRISAYTDWIRSHMQK